MNKCKVLWFGLCLEGLVFHLRVLIFDLKVRSLGLRAWFVCLFYSSATFTRFLRVDREDLDLKVWSFSVEGTFARLFSSPVILRCFLLVERGLNLGVYLQGRGHVCELVLLTRDLQIFLFSLKEKVLILKAFVLERERLIFRESLLVGNNDLLFPTLWVIVFSLEITFSPW